MKVRVQRMDSHLSRTASTHFIGDELEYQDNIACEGDVFVTQAFIGYASEQEMCRPYLRLMGEVKAIRGAFPYGVDEVTFGDSRLCPKVDYRYEFSNDELSELCKKGLFDKGFHCPDIFFNNKFELPMICNCNAIRPQYENEVPLLFIGVENQYNLETSSALSGYPIASYFDMKKQNEIEFDDMDVEYEDLAHADNLYDKSEVHQLETPQVSEPELTEEDILLGKAFENIEERVQDKVDKDAVERDARQSQEVDIVSDEVEDESLPEESVDNVKESEDEKVKKDVVKQQAVHDNQQANKDKVTAHKTVPSNIQEIVDKDVEFVESDEFGASI